MWCTDDVTLAHTALRLARPGSYARKRKVCGVRQQNPRLSKNSVIKLIMFLITGGRARPIDGGERAMPIDGILSKRVKIF